MKLVKWLAVFLCAVCITPVVGSAQDEYGAAVEESTRQFQEFVEAVTVFVKDVRFDEEDVKSVIANWDDFNALGEKEFAMDEEGEEDEMVNFNKLLAYPEYQSWAKSRGLDAENWMKKFMRIQVSLMQGALSENMTGGQAQMKAQLAELEAQRAQMGEEVYQQMKQAMEQGMAAMSGITSSYDKLPKPTDAEKAVIEKYKSQLMNLQ